MHSMNTTGISLHCVSCFQLLIQNGAVVSLTNKNGETPLDKVKESLQDKLKGKGIKLL